MYFLESVDASAADFLSQAYFMTLAPENQDSELHHTM